MDCLRVAVIGSGPSGAYCAQSLCEEPDLDVRVDVFERLPSPFGLVRYGVAPDHQKIKSIVASFSEIYKDPRVRFHGNVEVGTHVTVAELRERYDAVIVASGASVDRRLHLAGEDLPGVYSATDFVAWYSGHPDAPVDRFSFDTERVVVVGAGNVALDVARVMCRTADELRRTDVPEHVVEVLAESEVREIHVAARRGPAFAKYTNKELLELRTLDSADIVVRLPELVLDTAQEQSLAADTLAARRLAILHDLARTPTAGRPRSIHLRYGLVPEAFLGERSLSAVRFRQGESVVDLGADLAFRSIGYRSSSLDGVPFDAASSTIPHLQGRVLHQERPEPGLYVVGWIKRGPSGVIGTNRKDALETVGALLDDRRAGRLRRHSNLALAGAPIVGTQVVDWRGWQAIDRGERDRGRELGRERVKLHDRARMLALADAVGRTGPDVTDVRSGVPLLMRSTGSGHDQGTGGRRRWS